MNTKRIIYAPLALVAALGMPLTALAASSDWAGPYVGINGGYAQDKNVTIGTSNSFDVTGGFGGVQAGYNWAAGSVVVGLQADANAADIKGDGTCGVGVSCSTKMDQLYKIQGRVGLPLNNFLLYLSAGGASGQIEAKRGAFSDSTYQTGWLAGLGGAMAFNSHWNGNIEIQYIDFGNNKYTLNGNSVGVDSKFTTVGIGINYKF